MLFNSLDFLVFFIIFYSAYVLLGRRGQNRLLLVASYIFYGAWDWRFLGLLMLSTCIDWALGVAMGNSRDNPGRMRQLIVTSVIVNLTILGFFKYFNFFADSFAQLLLMFDVHVAPRTLDIILPVGVSFYTFQSMSYTIDVYRGRLEPCRRLYDFAVFVALFPQLVAGPIERATHILPQLANPRVITREKIAAGLQLILIGFVKKVVIADNLATTVNVIFAKETGFEPGEALIGTLFFAFQIYCDFSGYTDIARGISKLMGFDLMENFNLPYFARNPSDFWRRWHISLSSWLRDYLYVPLGGNRGGNFATCRNLMLTMVLGGLWHGAAWNFVAWGIYHGSLLIGHRLITEHIERSPQLARAAWVRWLDGPISIALMFVFTLYGWLLFRAGSATQIINMTAALPNVQLDGFLLKHLAKLAFFAGPLILLEFVQYHAKRKDVLDFMPVPAQAVTYASLFVFFIVLGNYDGSSFIYFQF